MLTCDIIVQNVNAPTEDKIDDVKNSFYEEFECELIKVHKQHTKNLVRIVFAKEGREDILKPTIRNETLH
jgi:hypothetical protein